LDSFFHTYFGDIAAPPFCPHCFVCEAKRWGQRGWNYLGSRGAGSLSSDSAFTDEMVDANIPGATAVAAVNFKKLRRLILLSVMTASLTIFS